MGREEVAILGFQENTGFLNITAICGEASNRYAESGIVRPSSLVSPPLLCPEVVVAHSPTRPFSCPEPLYKLFPPPACLFPHP